MHSGLYLMGAQVVSGSNALREVFMKTIKEYGIFFSENTYRCAI
jgi:hypothetical protein